MIALGAGSVGLCYVLYRAKFVARALAALGIVGYICLFVSGWLVIFGSDLGLLMFVPGAVFEVAFPRWLIIQASTRLLSPKHERHPTPVPAPVLSGAAQPDDGN